MNKYKIEFKWAIIFVLMTLVWMVLEKIAGFHSTHIDKHGIVTNFIAIPAIAVYVFALLDKRKKYYSGLMTYMQGFRAGLIITLIVTILSPLTQYITSAIITPEYFKNVIQNSVNEGKMTQEAAESFFNMKSFIIQGLIGAPIMGIITSAIVAIFTRRRSGQLDKLTS